MNELNNIIRTLTASGRRKKMFAAAFVIMAVLVAVFVWIILIRPAESKSGTVTCELEEHVHTEECYRYICGFDCYSDSVVTDTAEETADKYCVTETAYETSYDYNTENEAEFYEINDEDYSEESGSEISHEEDTDDYLSEVESAEASEEEPEEIIPAETTHVHTDACLALVCGKQEHIHSAACADVFAVEKTEDEESESDKDIPEDELTGDELDDSELTDEEIAELLDRRLEHGMLRPVTYMGLAGQTSAPEAGKIYRIKCVDPSCKGYLGIVPGDDGIISKGDIISGNTQEGTLFKLFDAGDGFFYIRPYGYENLAVDIVNAGQDTTPKIQIWDVYEEDWQKFKIELINGQDSYKVYAKDFNAINANNKYWYISSDKTLVMDYYSTNNTKKFTFEEYIPDETFSIEARVIFGDYNDQDYGHEDIGGIDATRYKNLEDALSLSLCYRDSSSNFNWVEDITHLNTVSNDKPARKDWCYQYNYTWNNLTPIDGNNNPGYYVKANGSGGIITVNGRQYKAKYIDADKFGKISEDPAKQGYQNGYEETAEHVFMNKGGIIYIYLDPLEDYTWYYNKEKKEIEQPSTLNLTMKKRWDGYNEGDDVYKNRPKEKIIIQLQKFENNHWVECTSQNVTRKDKAYTNYTYYTNDNGLYAKLDGVEFGADIAEKDRLKIVINGDTVDYQNPEGKYINKNTITFGQCDSKDRLQLWLTMEQSNNVVLTVDGKNNPQHFPIGYYYAWNNIPYGEYRVVETKAFYDVNDNDKYDEYTDRETSSEYHYMSFPPSRNSDGILHLQNFTNSMIIDVQKEWFDEDGNPDISRNDQITFDVWRTTEEAAKTNPTYYTMEKVGEFTTSNKFIHIDSTSNGGNIDLSPFDSEMNKYYYFIKEHNTDGYELINGKEGFVQTTEGTGIYGIDYEDGDIRRFVVQNRKIKVVETYGLKIQKEWYADSAGTQELNYSGITPQFKIYQSDKAVSSTAELMDSTPVQIANIKNNQLFELDRFNESIAYGYGIRNNRIEYTKNEEIIDKKVFENDGSKPPEFDQQNKCIKLRHSTSDSKTLWIKTLTINAGGKLELVFQKDAYSVTKAVIRDNNNNAVLKDFEIPKGNGEYNFTYEINVTNSNYKLQAEKIDGNMTDPHLISLTFTPYYYYYIQESTSDNYRLINGDDNGFVKIDNSWSVLSNNVENEFPLVTAKNQPVMKLDITKKWYRDSNISYGNHITTDNLADQSARFRLYKSFTNTQTPNNNLTQVKYPADNDKDYFELDTSGTSTITGLPAYEPDSGGALKKVYYYIQEAEGNYLLLNESVNGFIKSNDIQNYGVSFDMGVSSHQFEFINKPKIRLTVQKEWYDRDAQPDTAKNTEVCFMLLRSSANIHNFTDRFLNEDGTLIRDIEIDDSNGCKLTDKDGTKENFLIVINDIDNENPKNYFTTYNRELKFSSEDESGYVHPGKFEAYNGSRSPVFYYVLEIDDPDKTHTPGYVLSAYKVSTDKQAVTWSKFGEEQTVTITNLEKRVESFVMPETGGSGTAAYKTTGAVICTAALFLSIKSIRRKSGEEINKNKIL